MARMLPCLFAIGLCAYVIWYLRAPLSDAFSPVVKTADYLMDALGGGLK